MPAFMLLTFVAGLVDAASVLGLGRVFTANMTGNVLYLGFALGGATDVSITASLVALAGFLAGALCGGRLAPSAAGRDLTVPFALELAFLATAAGVAAIAGGHALAPRAALLLLLAAAMGIQSAVVRRLAVPDVTTIVLTLTLTGLAADSSLAGGGNPRVGRRLGAVAVMLAGGLAGALLLRGGLAVLIGAAAVAQGAALASLRPAVAASA